MVLPVHILKIQGPSGTCIEDTGSFRYIHWRYRVLPVHAFKWQGPSGTYIEDTGSFRYIHWRYRVLPVHSLKIQGPSGTYTLKIQGPSGTCIKDTGSFLYINWIYNVCIYLLVPVVHALGLHSLYPLFYWCFCLFFMSFRFLLVPSGNKWHPCWTAGVCSELVMVRSFGLGIPGTRNVYNFVSIIFNAHSNVNITSSRNSEPKRTHHYLLYRWVIYILQHRLTH